MKIKVKKLPYEEVVRLLRPIHKNPTKPSRVLKSLIKILSDCGLSGCDFSVSSEVKSIDKDEPVLYLMNHSCFTDLMIASKLIWPRDFHIICTSDGFVGKEGLMRRIGCIPTRKFVTDVSLVKDIVYVIKKLHNSVLMYPEASYSFDGTATPLPKELGKLIKMLGVNVVMIKTEGAFLQDPLYNCLQKRNVSISASATLLFGKDELLSESVEKINETLKDAFSFDYFKDQQEKGLKVTEAFRADGLNRVLYKCPHCAMEGHMEGRGIFITCNNCGVSYELTEDGYLRCTNAEGKFNHIPDWYAWERACVRQEIEDGVYTLSVPVDICMMVDYNAIYEVGKGRLLHNSEGFTLTGFYSETENSMCDGQLNYRQSPKASYSLYADYYWYELGDVICIGNMDVLYYCFPKCAGDFVAKTRLAAEEMYKLYQNP